MLFTLLLIFATIYPCAAQPWDAWSKDKDEAFETAREQDKFILLFVGNPECPICQYTAGVFFDEEGPHKSIIEENYIGFYSYFFSSDRNAEVMEYIADYWERRLKGESILLPWVFVIDPTNEGESVHSSYARHSEAELLKMLQVDLLAGSKLKWYKDKDQVLRLAKQQKKLIFKFTGKGTSGNSQTVMKTLNEFAVQGTSTLLPARPSIEENYILWYSEDLTEVDLENESSPADKKSLPGITIINPDNPDGIVYETWGVQDAETIETIIKNNIVSNEKIATPNIVTVSGSVIHISNQSNNERIDLFTLSGQLITTFRKDDFSLHIDASNLPKGILIISSSTGWSTKILF